MLSAYNWAVPISRDSADFTNASAVSKLQWSRWLRHTPRLPDVTAARSMVRSCVVASAPVGKIPVEGVVTQRIGPRGVRPPLGT